MIKEIKYNGYTANPSDYECADGDLALTMGLVQENGAMKPILPPTNVCYFDANIKVIYIHKTAYFTHYVLYNSNDYSLYWSDVKTPSVLHFISKFPELHSISTIGNLIVVLLENNTIYIKWDYTTYMVLGNKPPFVTIDFKLTDESQSTTNSYHFEPTDDNERKDIVGWTENGRGSRRPFYNSPLSEDVSNALWGDILSKVTELNNENIFYQPFFIRYAYRLFDGQHNWLSAPILMIPFTGPLIAKANVEKNVEGDSLDFTMTLEIYGGKINYRFVSPPIEDLKRWSDIVSHIDIFISAPIYTYDQSKKIWSFSSGVSMNNRYNHVSALGDTEKIIKYEETDNEGNRINYFVIPPSLETESVIDMNYTQDTDINDKIISTALFYKISEIAIADLIEDREVGYYDGVILSRGRIEDEEGGSDYLTYTLADNNFKPLYLKVNTVGSLLTKETLKEDYLSHHDLAAKCVSDYNSRLHLANVKHIPFSSFPIRSAIQYRKPKDDASVLKDATLFCYTIHLARNGVLANSQLIVDDRYPVDTNLSIHSIDSIDTIFPRYIFYPDPIATEIKLSVSFPDDGTGYIKARIYTLPLTTHPTLNGAYYYRGIQPDAPMPDYVDSEAPIPAKKGNSFYFETNKLYSSDVNNPFYFRPDNIRLISTGEILGIASAAKALSQGQFGQFPLYAFTSQGVWALSPSTTGTFEPAQPITRDVVINPDSITQIDSAVLFATDRGIMHISGSTVQCISDRLNTEELFSIADLPKCDKLINIFNGKADESEQVTLADITLLPFNEFLQGCRMVYDYTNQHLIVYNPAVRYAYVYSLKSQTWGMMRSDIVGNVNSYPEALAMADGAKLVDFSKPVAENITALIITRPFKIDDPDALKTIETIIQRGMFRSTHVQQVLYGSNDLFNWHPVWSSVDKIMRGFRGTPYKAFRLALVCKLDKNESIYGCTVVYNPRMTNQVR